MQADILAVHVRNALRMVPDYPQGIYSAERSMARIDCETHARARVEYQLVEIDLSLNHGAEMVVISETQATAADMICDLRQSFPKACPAVHLRLLGQRECPLAVNGVGALRGDEDTRPHRFKQAKMGLQGMELSRGALLPGIGVAVLLGVVVGLPPALRAMRLSIVDALADKR